RSAASFQTRRSSGLGVGAAADGTGRCRRGGQTGSSRDSAAGQGFAVLEAGIAGREAGIGIAVFTRGVIGSHREVSLVDGEVAVDSSAVEVGGPQSLD